jgi:hypothetical protein
VKADRTLCWPAGRPQTQYPKRSRFEANFARARDCLMREINLLGGRNAVLSTNIPLRRDGLPFANYKVPTDKGVAVYFTYKDRQVCFACDAWDKIEDNMQAVWKTIEAPRGHRPLGSRRHDGACLQRVRGIASAGRARKAPLVDRA